MGDASHAAFSRAPDVPAAALAAQRSLRAESWDEIGGLRVRIALHTGAAQERDGDDYGPPLNRAARLASIGHGGQILVSRITADLVRETLSAGIRLLDLGQHRLKDLAEPEHVFQVLAPDLASDFPPLASLDARPNNLPVHPTPLLGRDEDVSRVCGRLLRDNVRLLTLTGPGGTGKTRLSLQIAAELIDHCTDGAYFVALAPISDPDLVASTIAQAPRLPLPTTPPRQRRRRHPEQPDHLRSEPSLDPAHRAPGSANPANTPSCRQFDETITFQARRCNATEHCDSS